jgi:DNA-binding CsgD family transcriptional regulator
MVAVKPLDLIGVIELAYNLDGDDVSWLEALTRAIAPALSVGAPTSSFFFDIRGDAVEVGHLASVGSKPFSRADYQRFHDRGSTATLPPRIAYECDVFAVLSRVLGTDVTREAMRAAEMGGEDAVGLRANATAESGVVLTTFVPLGFRLRDKDLWSRLAAHLGCALRLRRAQRPPGPDSAAAVLDVGGRLAHGNAATIAVREDLAGAAKAMDSARGKMRRLNPEAATEMWRAMVQGAWTLVDWVDHDGKRFLLAQENKVPSSSQLPLTPREQQVAACAAMGHSNKLIAYDLGLSVGSVAVLLSRAAKKLGVRGRVGLIRAFREHRNA